MRLRYVMCLSMRGKGEVHLKFTSKGKELCLNQTKVSRFSDFMGMFPTVVLCAEDMQFLRGAPSLRRRFLDLTLAAMDSGYFDCLRKYHRTLMQRNVLLRERSICRKTLEAYDVILAALAHSLYCMRREAIGVISGFLRDSYNAISLEKEVPDLLYKPDSEIDSAEAFLELLQSNFQRDSLLKSTQRGPHRDDFEFRINEKLARLYASEGQQRTLVVALRLAQIAYFKQQSGLKPILLADDVLGQLDPKRGEAFWEALDPGLQVIATGTSLDSVLKDRDWQVFNVCSGQFSLCGNTIPELCTI